MSMYTYNVLDLELNDYIGIDVSSSRAEQLTGLQTNKISKYATNKFIYRKRYKITHNAIILSKEEKSKSRSKATLDLMDKWDNDMLLAVQMLRDETGRRVFKRGKPSHVERVR